MTMWNALYLLSTLLSSPLPCPLFSPFPLFSFSSFLQTPLAQRPSDCSFKSALWMNLLTYWLPCNLLAGNDFVPFYLLNLWPILSVKLGFCNNFINQIIETGLLGAFPLPFDRTTYIGGGENRQEAERHSRPYHLVSSTCDHSFNNCTWRDV